MTRGISASTARSPWSRAAGSGIGQAIALKFAAQGAVIRVFDVNEAAAKPRPVSKSRRAAEQRPRTFAM